MGDVNVRASNQITPSWVMQEASSHSTLAVCTGASGKEAA